MKQNTNIHTSLIPLRGLIAFPSIVLHFDVSREMSKKAIAAAADNDNLIVLAMQTDAEIEEPDESQIYKVATLCKIKQVLELPGNALRIVAIGLERVRVQDLQTDNGFFEADCISLQNTKEIHGITVSALKKSILEALEKYSEVNNVKSDALPLEELNATQLCDAVSFHFVENIQDKQTLLETSPLSKRMEKLYEILIMQTEVAQMQKRIQDRVKEQVNKSQRDFYLNEQIKSIQIELGNTNAQEIDEMRKKLTALPINDEAKDKLSHEIDRLFQMPMGSPELVVSRTYIEYILDLPWGKFTEDELSIAHAKKILDKHHYGLEKVKERIIEFIAVLNNKKNMRGPILCFVGPPGVGKTSIVRAISEATGRKFVKMSLGGVRDEAEIRGHRRTYVGAIPGRIISGIKQAGTMNPLFLFDEIDKMASDFRGDPASALLEVLDSEQNNAFRDHYLEIPFDLSNVMFITTANSLDSIPAPLLDRLEIIEVPSYTFEEKLQIAKKHLLPKQIMEHGLKAKSVKMNDRVLAEVIESYTRESGVRSLERTIAKIVRKSLVAMMEVEKETFTVQLATLTKFLGKQKFSKENLEKKAQVGLVNGMAYTPYGGVVLTIECVTLKGNGKLQLTGKLGEVMKESANAALSWVRSHAKEFGIAEDFISNNDIHIHVPEGAVPKDGPSAGVTLTCALLSALSGKKVLQNIAMTGEITLRGNVLPIGGVREKLFAAYRNNLKTIFIPAENVKDLDDLPKAVLDELKIYPVKTIQEITEHIFEG